MTTDHVDPSPKRADEMILTADDLDRLGSRFGIQRLEPLGGFENLILRSVDPPGRIVRLAHTSRRSLEMVQAEVDFMRHLADAGVPVVTPLKTVDGTLVDVFRADDEDVSIASCMSQAPGVILPAEDWADPDIVAYGDLLGRAHVAARDFDPGAARRPDWTDPFFDPGIDQLDDPPVVAAFHEAHRQAGAHPAGGTGLLIHQDAHHWNLHVAPDSLLTLFDFDDCGYGTAEHDFAIVLFYRLLAAWPDPIAELRRFLPLFLEGYERHAGFSTDWPEGVDLILKVREADIYFLLITDAEEPTGSEAAFMVDRRRRILDGTPYLGVQLESLL